MKSEKVIVALFLLSLSLMSCRSVAQEHKKLPNDMEWVSKSIEYAALCKQVYSMAWPVVKENTKSITENWTVVLDVDETVLNNIQYAIERVQVDSGFTQQSWSKWVQREEAPPLSGVTSFLDSVRTLGAYAHVAFITNRMFSNEDATIANLKKFGLYKDGDVMLTRKSHQDTKEDRRRALEEGTGRCAANGPMKLVALFGDNIRDFMPMRGREKAAHYRSEELAKDPRWGTKYFVLPNPRYGSWERDYR